MLARELVWMLAARLQASEDGFIGSGAGNLRVEDAVRAWLRGVRRALPMRLPRKIRTKGLHSRHPPTNFLFIHRALVNARSLCARFGSP